MNDYCQIIRDDFAALDRKNPQALWDFFHKYKFFSTYDLAIVLDATARTIRDLKGVSGLRREGVGPLPSNIRLKTQVELPENWDVREWWEANYPRYGIYMLSKITGLNKLTVRKRLRRYGIKTISKKEAEFSKHPCCNVEWLKEHYYKNDMSLRACARLAGVSTDTIRGWMIAFKLQTRCPLWFRCGLSH